MTVQDNQRSFVRLLVSSNQFDIEALVATTSRHLRAKPRPDVMRSVVEAYGKVQANLARHEPGFPGADALTKLVVSGQDSYGMAAVGEGRMTPGAEAIVRAMNSADPRPLWVSVWGGANTLAQALWQVRATRPAADVARVVDKLRVYTISDQDDAGPWLRREFPALHYIATPGDNNDYHLATWSGIGGDEFYRNGAGADFTTVSEAWVDEHMRKKGPLGAFYPLPCCIIEGDTPSFLSLMNNGLVSSMNPTFGGWGGRYVWRQPWLETRPYWTNARLSRDTVVGADGKSYTSDQATIWRWREAFQHDFAARMDWTIKDVAQANHNPHVTVNGIEGKAPLISSVTPVTRLIAAVRTAIQSGEYPSANARLAVEKSRGASTRSCNWREALVVARRARQRSRVSLRVLRRPHLAAVLSHDDDEIGEREHERHRPPDQRHGQSVRRGRPVIGGHRVLGRERRVQHHGKHADRGAGQQAGDHRARSRKGATLRCAAQPGEERPGSSHDHRDRQPGERPLDHRLVQAQAARPRFPARRQPTARMRSSIAGARDVRFAGVADRSS